MSLSPAFTPSFAAQRGMPNRSSSGGDLLVNLDAKNAKLGGEKLHLTAKEYQILALLPSARDRP